jgi:hypothetical protein
LKEIFNLGNIKGHTDSIKVNVPKLVFSSLQIIAIPKVLCWSALSRRRSKIWFPSANVLSQMLLNVPELDRRMFSWQLVSQKHIGNG